jgi:uncharacterized protein YidB (DUF937 family)
MPKLLTRLRIDEVSAVDAGAGEGVKILLMKRNDSAKAKDHTRKDKPMSKFMDFFVGKRTPSDEIAKSTSALAESVGSIIHSEANDETKNKALTETFEQFQEHLERNIVAGPAVEKTGDKTMLKELAKLLGLKEDAGEEDISKAIAARDQEIVLLKANMSGEERVYHDKLAAAEQEPFRKMKSEERKALMHKKDDLPEYVRKLISDGEEAQKRVAKLEEAQEIQKFEKIARENGVPTTEAPALMKLSKADPEALNKLLAHTKAGWAAANKAGAFSEIGGTGAGANGVTAFDEFKAKAAELRKTQPNLTEAQAFAKVYEDPANIEIAKRERAESRVVVNPPGTMA